MKGEEDLIRILEALGARNAAPGDKCGNPLLAAQAQLKHVKACEGAAQNISG